MAGVTFKGVTKRYGDVTAVESLDLEIVDGEFMVLLGPSGCGKSTALRMIAGLETISDGELLIGDRVVNDVDPAERDISMVFQSYALYPHMTVRRNIESPLVVRSYPVDGPDHPYRKLTKEERAERVTEAARVLDLEPYLDRKPAVLSGGQRQRVALARAFVGRPKAFLMDEPLSNLDAKLRANTRIELVELHERVGTTVVYVTHDQVEAMTMATRVAVMSMGKLQQVGTPREVYDRPVNTFVAQFIGTPPMNCLDGVMGAGGTVDIVGGWLAGPTASPDGPVSMAKLDRGRKVVAGVRPEDLVITTDGTVRGEVRAVEWLGHECLLFVKVGDQQLVIRQPGTTDRSVGDVVTLAADPADVHLFDADTTERIA
ncbi:MAG: sn-glycerol-3-phosphate ABC transporter ATP-binding protein UgpC [Microthrixaceae bacterium]|nr:sn-glycerol-3-phosphate ABC transporter ATP-binding protein UgpC [Acidimicrobiales bacterium]MCB9404742.1 sn-glycerol-3-phosphate ABC transporter ATP-binding protein UgpC [Microthrixaceae bacterium]